MMPGILIPRVRSWNPGTLIDTQTFSTPGAAIWIKVHDGSYAIIELWGGGGSGGHAYNGGSDGQGGEGGDYRRYRVGLQWLSATENLTVGAGGAATTSNGNSGLPGGYSVFGSAIWSQGGFGGRGQFTTAVSASTYTPTDPRSSSIWELELYEEGANGVSGSNPGNPATYAGGGGGGVNNGSGNQAGGASIHGGAGGIGGNAVSAANGAGQQPGGGGGGAVGSPDASGVGGDGKIVVRVYA